MVPWRPALEGRWRWRWHRRRQSHNIPFHLFISALFKFTFAVCAVAAAARRRFQSVHYESVVFVFSCFFLVCVCVSPAAARRRRRRHSATQWFFCTPSVRACISRCESSEYPSTRAARANEEEHTERRFGRTKLGTSLLSKWLTPPPKHIRAHNTPHVRAASRAGWCDSDS